MNKKAFGIVLIIVVVAVLALLGGGAIYYKSKISSSSDTSNGDSAKSTAVPSPTASQDKTAGWKTYRNNYYGFEVKYPPNGSVTETANGSIQISSESGGFNISYRNYYDKSLGRNLTFDEVIKNTSTGMDTSAAYMEVDGVPAREFSYNMGLHPIILIYVEPKNSKDEKYWEIDLEPNFETEEASTQTLRQILSIFKFTVPTAKSRERILSPSNEERLIAGTKYTIRWTNGEDKNETVLISANSREIVSTKNSGSYDWYIPRNFPEGQYHITIQRGDLNLESAPFIISPGSKE